MPGRLDVVEVLLRDGALEHEQAVQEVGHHGGAARIAADRSGGSGARAAGDGVPEAAEGALVAVVEALPTPGSTHPLPASTGGSRLLPLRPPTIAGAYANGVLPCFQLHGQD